MKQFAIALLSLCLLFPTGSYAQDSPNSATPAVDPGLLRACGAAVDELKAARQLIEAQRKEIEAAAARLEVEKQRLQFFAEKNQLQIEQADALRVQIEAMEKAKAILLDLQQRQQERIAKLEENLSKARRRTVIGILVGILTGAILRK